MTAQEAQAEVEKLWGRLTAVDYMPGVPQWETRYRVYHEGEVWGWGNSYAEAVAHAKTLHPVVA